MIKHAILYPLHLLSTDSEGYDKKEKQKQKQEKTGEEEEETEKETKTNPKEKSFLNYVESWTCRHLLELGCDCTSPGGVVHIVHTAAYLEGAPRALQSCALKGFLIPCSCAMQRAGQTLDPSGIALLE